MTEEAKAYLETIIQGFEAAGVDETVLATDATIQPTLMSASAPPPQGGPMTLELQALPPMRIAAPDEEPPTSGQRDALSDYSVLGTLGEGGMGVVQLASQHSLRREVALKRVHEGGSEREMRALLEEAMFTGYLEHPNIIPVHTLGVDDEQRPVLVMKRVEGVVWRSLIQDDAHVFWNDVVGDRLVWHLEVFSQVCNAIHFAHNRGVINRDIKPENVMVGAFGEVYVLDWGVGMRLGKGQRVHASIAGTPAYMAPEMLHGDPSLLSERTDVFLLGATLHELLTGESRHTGDSVQAVMFAALTLTPYDYGEDVPAELAQICNKACALEVEDRYASVLELKRAVEAFLAHRASLELSREAAVSLEVLEGLVSDEASEALDVHKRYTEARFGFEHALKSWEGNANAQEGLKRCIVSMVTFEIAHRQAQSARLLLAELNEPPATLVKRLEALEMSLQEEEAERERMKALARDMDANVGRKQRTMLLMFLIATITVGASLLIMANTLNLFEVGYAQTLVPPMIFLSILLAVLWRWRATLLGNRFNRNVSLTVLVLMVSLITSRMLGALLDQDLKITFIHDGAHAFSVALLAAAVLSKMFIVPALIILVGLVVGALVPQHLPTVLLPFVLMAVASVVLMWRKMRKVDAEPGVP